MSSHHGISAFLVQWCEAQKQFHIESTETLSPSEVRLFLNGESVPSYRTLAVFKTEKQALGFVQLAAKKRGLLGDESLMHWKDHKSHAK
jgi:hypothetical protein